MVHFDWRHVITQHERRTHEISRLQQRRQGDALMQGAPRAPKLHHRLLAYVGRMLVDLGWQLQSPYNRMVVRPHINPRRPLPTPD